MRVIRAMAGKTAVGALPKAAIPVVMEEVVEKGLSTLIQRMLIYSSCQFLSSDANDTTQITTFWLLL